MKRFFIILVSFLLIASCHEKKHYDSEIENFIVAISGTFSSEAQSKIELGYNDLTLVNISIWKDKPGYWLYSENFLSKQYSNVILQRIINIERIDSTTIKTTQYNINKPDAYKNAWKDVKLFDNLDVNELTQKTGCEIFYIKKTSTIYQGQSKPKTCLSKLDNVSFIMTNIVLSEDKISVWVKGYNESGKQIWGKIKGPYQYVRLK